MAAAANSGRLWLFVRLFPFLPLCCPNSAPWLPETAPAADPDAPAADLRLPWLPQLLPDPGRGSPRSCSGTWLRILMQIIS